MLFGHLYVFFEEMSRYPGHFFIGLFEFSDIELHECLYVLEINPSSVASFVHLFSHSEGCLFVMFMVSFAMQKFLNLIRSLLFMFLFSLL